MKLQSFTINDSIEPPLQYAIEVTLLLVSGESRWCLFATPESLTVFGDFLGKGPTRIHYGLSHMILVETVTPETIAAALKQIDDAGSICDVSRPLNSIGRKSNSDQADQN